MLELRHVSSGYGNRKILHDISLCIRPGQLTAIVGPNGSGKSTLLKTAMGLLPAYSGEILLDRSSVKGQKPAALAKKIAWLSQGKAIPDMTVSQLVLHGRFSHLSYPRRYGRDDRRIAQEAMEQLELTALGERPLSSLSGGQQQSAYLAMALAQESPYILLDEPTAYLDIANSFHLMDILRSLSVGGKGIAAVLHDLPLAMTYADGIAVLENGRLAAFGAPEELFSTGVIDRIFGVSLRRDGGSYWCKNPGRD